MADSESTALEPIGPVSNLPANYYTLGVDEDANDALWTSAGFGGPSIAEFFGYASGQRITGRAALQQAAVLICLDVLAQDLSKAALRMERRVKGGWIEVEPHEHPVAEMLAIEPNPRHTWVEFKQMLVYHLGMVSNSYALVQRKVDGDPIYMVPVAPGRVGERIDQLNGAVFYDVSASTIQEAALLGFEYRAVPERNILHVRNRMLDGFYGASTLDIAGPALTLAREVDDFQRRTFSGNSMSRGFFSREAGKGAMTDPVFARMQQQLRKLVQRTRNPEDPVLLEDGITYKEYMSKANDAEMSKALDKAVENTCKLWRMPPHKALHFANVKYENLATMEMVYVRDTLIPIASLIEERMSKTLLTRRERAEFRFIFDRDDLTVADENIHRQWIQMALDRGAISLNEAREEMGWNPREGGDVYLKPVNMTLIDTEGNVVVGPAESGDQADADQTETETGDEPKAANDRSLRLVSEN